ncbi:hypothetical protein BC941DRAFT_234521 [Chlamydoabsidia padenii]|nr:hypothetical protein BC941DRAFT_234521 [Chlamydoabsidia padenii]
MRFLFSYSSSCFSSFSFFFKSLFWVSSNISWYISSLSVLDFTPFFDFLPFLFKFVEGGLSRFILISGSAILASAPSDTLMASDISCWVENALIEEWMEKRIFSTRKSILSLLLLISSDRLINVSSKIIFIGSGINISGNNGKIFFGSNFKIIIGSIGKIIFGKGVIDYSCKRRREKTKFSYFFFFVTEIANVCIVNLKVSISGNNSG